MEVFDKTYETDRGFIMGYSNQTNNASTDITFLFKTLRLIYIKKGVVDWQIGNEIYMLREGDIALFNNISPRKILKIYSPLSYDLFGFMPNLLNVPLIPLLFYGESTKVIIGKNTEWIRLMLNELSAEIASENVYKYELIKNLLYVILINIARLAGVSEKGHKNVKTVVAEAAQYIQNNPSSDLSLSSLAKIFGYSNAHFSRTFKKYTAASLTDYIANVRIENALHLIHSKDFNVLTAALQSGFGSSSGFYKAFKKHRGHPPRAF
ncbi:MAG: AraC family transcriptional regulator [Firmicutes bacterium]|nr:AraC family transcriptional regulator [Bacillota bacterium]